MPKNKEKLVEQIAVLTRFNHTTILSRSNGQEISEYI